MTDLTVDSANSNNAGNLAQQYGPSYFNRPQRFIINYSWDIPSGKHNGAAGAILSGWNLSGVTTIQDGAPMTIIDTRGGAAFGLGTGGTVQSGFGRAQLCPGATAANVTTSGGIESRRRIQRRTGYFNTAAFCAPPVMPNGVTPPPTAACPTCATLFGNSGMGILPGPGQFNFDMSILKTTKITERSTLQFRAEFFNLFNHPQFNQPNYAPGNVTLPTVTSTTFGFITSTSVNPRVIQLGAKFIF